MSYEGLGMNPPFIGWKVPCSHTCPRYVDSDGNDRCDECDRVVARPHDFGGNST